MVLYIFFSFRDRSKYCRVSTFSRDGKLFAWCNGEVWVSYSSLTTWFIAYDLLLLSHTMQVHYTIVIFSKVPYYELKYDIPTFVFCGICKISQYIELVSAFLCASCLSCENAQWSGGNVHVIFISGKTNSPNILCAHALRSINALLLFLHVCGSSKSKANSLCS